MNGELFFLYIFDSFLSHTDRRIIESNTSHSAPSQSTSLSISSARFLTGKNNMGSFSKFIGPNNVKMSDIYDFKLNNGLITRIFSGNFNNDISYFNNTNNTPILTGVTTNLKNIYCTSGGAIEGFDSNFLTNNSFQNGNGMPQCNPSENNPTNDIIALDNPGDSPYVLRQTGYYAEYEVTLGNQLLPNTTYVMSGWYSKSNDYNGTDTMFHARAYSSSGNQIYTDLGLFNIIESRVIGGLTWHYCYHTITTPSDYSYFKWFIGYGANNSTGYRYYTKLSVQKMNVVSQELYGVFYAPVSGIYKFHQASDSLSYTWLGDSAMSAFTTSNCLIKTFKARYLTFEYGNTIGQGRYLQSSGVRVYTSPDGANIINSSMITTSSSIFSYDFATANIVDNNDSTIYISTGEVYPWVKIDLGSECNIYRVELLNRIDGARARLAGVRLVLSNNNNDIIYTSKNVLNKSGSDIYQEGENAFMYYTFFPSINTEVYGSDSTPNTNQEITTTLVGGQYYPIRIQYGGIGYFNFSFTPPNGTRTYDGTGYFFSRGINNGSRNLINNSNLILHYQFNIGDTQSNQLANWASGTRTYDIALYNGASLKTSSYKSGKSSLYLNKDYGIQYLLNSSTTSTTNGLSFAVWYRSNNSGHWGRIFDFGNGANVDNIGCSPNAIGQNSLGFFCTPGDNFYLSDINYNDNKWRHIVWTLTYSPEGNYNSIWKIYIDGELKANLSGRAYPRPNITRNLSYIGKSNWEDGAYNGWIDDFRMYNRVLSDSEASILYSSDNVYLLKTGNTHITTIPQGSSYFNPATSGYAIYSSNPWLPNGYYWIKSFSMTNPLRMYVDIKNGGFDFYAIFGGTSITTYDATHSGIALGLELAVPRNKNNWRAIYNYVYNVLKTTYTNIMTALPVYNTISGGNYTSYAMFDRRFGNNGSYNGVPDWRVKDGGLWYLKDVAWGEPNGDYTGNGFLGSYSIETYPQFLTEYGSPGFNDLWAGYATGPNYIVSTNYAGSSIFSIDIYYDGSEYHKAAPSASYIKNLTGTEKNGVYWINLPEIGPTRIYCIMDSSIDGGGWMMAMKSGKSLALPSVLSSNTFSYGSFTNNDVFLGNIGLPSGYSSQTVSVKLRIYGQKTFSYNGMNGQCYVNDVNGNTIIASYVGDRANGSDSYDISDTVILTLNPNQFPLTVRAWVWYLGWYFYSMTANITISTSNDETLFNYNSDYWTTTNTLNSNDLTRDNQDAKFHTMNYFKAKDMLALWPDIPYNYNGGSGGNLSLPLYNNWCWLKNNFDSGTRRTLINLFGNVNNMSLGEPRGAERGTAFSSQPGNAFYGINFTSFPNMKVRWGFAWNNEGDWNSNDVTGGIGMYSSWGSLKSLSAGDQIGCCQDQIGINRTARVEMYIR